jgi:hypothetical protein
VMLVCCAITNIIEVLISAPNKSEPDMVKK